MITMISKHDLETMGFKPHQATEIIRKAKIHMVNSGYPYYNNKRLGVVPRNAVEKIIGNSPSNEEE